MTDRHLDGNAAGGILAEVFSADVTAALLTCACCGTASAVATAMVYLDGPGTVLRCSHCTALLLCVVEAPDGLHVDLSGVRRMQL
jgi:Family of unknown function (DUF6510)